MLATAYMEQNTSNQHYHLQSFYQIVLFLLIPVHHYVHYFTKVLLCIIATI